MKKIFFIISSLFIILAPVSASCYMGLCCGHCGGNMPLNIPGGGIPESHEWRFKLSGAFMNMNGLQDGADEVDASDLLGMPSKGKFMAVPTDMRMSMANISAGYSFSDDFAAMVMFMYGYKEMDMKFSDTMRKSVGENGFTMRSKGMADTMLMGKYRLYADDEFTPANQASLLFGLSMPTGSINEKFDHHPDRTQIGNPMPYSMQMGSGTFDPTIGILYQGSATPIWWGGDIRYSAGLYDNEMDYHLGDTLKTDLYAMYQVRYDTVLQLQLNWDYRQAISGRLHQSREDGVGHFRNDPDAPFTTPLYDPDNYGGHKLGITGGIQWQPVSLHVLELSFSTPLHQYTEGPQLKEEYSFMLTYYIEIPTSNSRRYLLLGQ